MQASPVSAEVWAELPDTERRRALAMLVAQRALSAGGWMVRPPAAELLSVAHYILTGEAVIVTEEPVNPLDPSVHMCTECRTKREKACEAANQEGTHP